MTAVLERPIVETRHQTDRAANDRHLRREQAPSRRSITLRRMPWGVAYGPDGFARCAERIEIVETRDLAP